MAGGVRQAPGQRSERRASHRARLRPAGRHAKTRRRQLHPAAALFSEPFLRGNAERPPRTGSNFMRNLFLGFLGACTAAQSMFLHNNRFRIALFKAIFVAAFRSMSDCAQSGEHGPGGEHAGVDFVGRNAELGPPAARLSRVGFQRGFRVASGCSRLRAGTGRLQWRWCGRR